MVNVPIVCLFTKDGRQTLDAVPPPCLSSRARALRVAERHCRTRGQALGRLRFFVSVLSTLAPTSPLRRVPSRCSPNIPFSETVNDSALIICSFYVFYATHGIFLSRDLKVFVPDFAFRPGSLHGSPWWLRWQRITCQSRIGGLDPWVRKIPWRRKWQPATVFLPGEPHGCRSLMGYSPWGHKE